MEPETLKNIKCYIIVKIVKCYIIIVKIVKCYIVGVFPPYRPQVSQWDKTEKDKVSWLFVNHNNN